MSFTVRISEELNEPIEKAIDTIKDEFGRKKFRNKKAVVDAALAQFLIENQIVEAQTE